MERSQPRSPLQLTRQNTSKRSFQANPNKNGNIQYEDDAFDLYENSPVIEEQMNRKKSNSRSRPRSHEEEYNHYNDNKNNDQLSSGSGNR